jgi:SAM-dependent methyltransferase
MLQPFQEAVTASPWGGEEREIVFTCVMDSMAIDPSQPQQLTRVHMGCGLTYLEGWINCDGGPSARVYDKLPHPLRSLIKRSGLIGKDSQSFWKFLDAHPIVYANARKPWPFESNSVDTIYSSHMIDCLTTDQISEFFNQAYRVLKPGGEFRLAGIDMDRVIQNYLDSQDAPTLVTMISYPDPKKDRLLKRIKQALFPPTIYLANLNFNMYKTLLQQAGFENIVKLPPGETRLQHYQPINLWQRQGESIYVEACKPRHGQRG